MLGHVGLAALLIAAAPAPELPAIFTVGMGTCGEWLKDHETKNAMQAQHDSWVVGYLSGWVSTAEIYGRNPLKGADPNGLIVWVDNYCRANPLDRVSTAVSHLAVELFTRAEPPK